MVLLAPGGHERYPEQVLDELPVLLLVAHHIGVMMQALRQFSEQLGLFLDGFGHCHGWVPSVVRADYGVGRILAVCSLESISRCAAAHPRTRTALLRRRLRPCCQKLTDRSPEAGVACPAFRAIFARDNLRRLIWPA